MGQALRIDGITPAAVYILLSHVKRKSIKHSLMDNLILNSYSKISSLNVSRETCNDFETLISMIQEKNREINIISKKTVEKPHKKPSYN